MTPEETLARVEAALRANANQLIGAPLTPERMRRACAVVEQHLHELLPDTPGERIVVEPTGDGVNITITIPTAAAAALGLAPHDVEDAIECTVGCHFDGDDRPCRTCRRCGEELRPHQWGELCPKLSTRVDGEAAP